MQVTIEVDPKYVPEGYEAIGYRRLVQGETTVASDGSIITAEAGHNMYFVSPWLIIRKKEVWRAATHQDLLNQMLKPKSLKMRHKETKMEIVEVIAMTYDYVSIRYSTHVVRDGIDITDIEVLETDTPPNA